MDTSASFAISLELDDISEDRRYAFTVYDIVDYSIGLTAYMDIDEMRELFGEEDDYFNMLVSDKDLKIDSGRVYFVTKRADIENAAGILGGVMLVYLVISSILTGKIKRIVPAEVLKNRE